MFLKIAVKEQEEIGARFAGSTLWDAFIRSVFTGRVLARGIDGSSTELDWRMVEAG